MTETKITSKNQTSIPQDIRDFLGVHHGDAVEWHTIKGMVVVKTKKKVKDPVKVLTSQTKGHFDIVKMIKEIREGTR